MKKVLLIVLGVIAITFIVLTFSNKTDAPTELPDEETEHMEEMEDESPREEDRTPEKSPEENIPGKPAECVVTGCSGQACVSADIAKDTATTCEFLDEYACYGSVGVCEVQASGQCGWTESEELQMCIDEARKDDVSNDISFYIEGENFEFSLEEIRVKKGQNVTINFTSTSGFHDWVVDEFSASTERVSSGGNTSVTFTADEAGEFEYYCSVGSHRAQGMVGTLIVEE